MFRQTTIKHEELTFGEKIGIGGFGIVYHGTWRHSDIAIKQLLMDKISPESAEEFEKEAQIMAQLHSPNIVQFYGFCMSPTYCLVMEYMPNGSLFSVLKSNQPLDWPLRFRIAIDIAKGVSFLHHEDILHRDIKSLNVLLDKTYQAKLTDFGLSKVKAETKSNSMASKTNKDSVGTLAWMAPELFKRKGVFTQKSDMYSLGITFWELASRKIPFADAASPELIPGWVQQGEREDIPKDCPSTLAALIEQCWSGVAEQRPDADKVVTLLKDSESTIKPSLPSSTTYPGTVNLSPVSVPQYRGNLSSEVSPKPLVFSEKPGKLSQVPTPAPTPVSPAIPLPKPSPKPSLTVNAKELSKFLSLVVAGQQDEAEEMLKSSPELALVSGDVTDHANRTFKNITGFQYAVWALDWHMWTMLRKYLPIEAAREQAKGFGEGSWVKEHGEYAGWKKLLDAQQTLIDNYSKWDWNKLNEHWVQQVGGAQLILPMHVLQEYCHPTRSFVPCPNFKDSSKLSRSLSTNVDLKKLGVDYGLARGWSGKLSALRYIRGRYVNNAFNEGISHDRKALAELSCTRTQQRGELVAELKSGNKPLVFSDKFATLNLSPTPSSVLQPIPAPKPSPTVTAKELSVFLSLVAEGEQAKAEEMLKKTPDLALMPTDVTDLSSRTFKNITGFQYALWALDWHMWTMIQKYMSDSAIKEQVGGYDKGSWVKPYGVSANWQNLVDTLSDQIKLLKAEKWSEATKQWQQTVGGAQRQLPAHVVNEYCHPSRSFNPCPDFTQGATTLPRARQTDEGEWFTASYNGGKLGEKFAVYRGPMDKASVMGVLVRGLVTYVTQDREACIALLATRTQQRDQLLGRYVPEKRVNMRKG